MHKNPIELDSVHGRLTILEEMSSRRYPNGRSYRCVLCCCSCGELKVINLESITRGLSQSCGCATKEGARAANSRREELAALQPALPDRFWERVNKNGPVPLHRPDLGPCWIWLGALDKDGYGLWWKNKRNARTHASTYIEFKGPIPDGLQPDHLCRVRACCNPAHLEAVTCRENLLRGSTAAASNAAKTHCPRGHAYDEGNTYVHGGHRMCRECNNAKRNARRRGQQV
jgi:hypothetical protein